MKPPAIILVPFVHLLHIVSAGVLQNPDFELPPLTLTPNSTVPFVFLNKNNTIPGWMTQGTVEYYLTSSTQHAILLVADGKINQTFVATGEVKQYLLAFTLAQGSQSTGPLKCLAATIISLVISVPDNDLRLEFSLEPTNREQLFHFSRVSLGSWGNEELINLFIQSLNTDTASSSNSTCWPVVDNLELEGRWPVK